MKINAKQVIRSRMKNNIISNCFGFVAIEVINTAMDRDLWVLCPKCYIN